MIPAPAASGTPLILFGGTFDPVHRAHISAARAVSKALQQAPVYLLPNAVPPHRPQPLADAGHRLAMLKLAIAAYPQLRLDDRELHRDGPSYTIDTLLELRHEQINRPLVLVIGADSLATLQHWYRWQEYPALCHLAVLPRPGSAEPEQQVLNAFPRADAGELCTLPAGRRLMLPAPNLDVSSTAIRQALAEKGDCPALDADVLAHIHQYGLYTVAVNASPNDEDS